MHLEIPRPTKCCFCFPLRRGLLLWVYLKLAAVLFMTIFISAKIGNLQRDTTFLVIASIGLFATTLDIIFNILFLISAHIKNFVYLRIFYRYAVIILIIEVLFLLGYIVFEIYISVDFPMVFFLLNYMIDTTCLFFSQIVMQLYFCILVRSELLKLENNTKIEFVNHVAEPECTAQIMA